MTNNQVQFWSIGDVFLIETLDGMNVLGQIVGQERNVLNSVSCAFYDIRTKHDEELAFDTALPLNRIFAVLFVTRDLLDTGVWRVIQNLPVTLPMTELPFERLRCTGFVGAKIVGSRNINEFLNAYYGLMPWDNWHDPTYLDKLLVSPEKRPEHVILRQS